MQVLLEGSMHAIAKITTKGQTAIPRQIRQALRVEDGHPPPAFRIDSAGGLTRRAEKNPSSDRPLTA